MLDKTVCDLKILHYFHLCCNMLAHKNECWYQVEALKLEDIHTIHFISVYINWQNVESGLHII